MTLTLEKDTITVPVLDETVRQFSFHDRCDRCGFQAYVIAQKGKLELNFCGHHGRRHTPALVGGGWSVLDFTHMINEKPSPSASGTEDEDEDLDLLF